MLVDWERAELAGMPGWDWLHFVVQPAILVEHAPIATVVGRLETLFESELFVRYAQLARIASLEKKLALAYLRYCVAVLRQSEGLQQIEELAAAAERKLGTAGVPSGTFLKKFSSCSIKRTASSSEPALTTAAGLFSELNNRNVQR